MKSILLFIICYLLISCNTNKVNESPIDYTLYREVFTISYGDDRFHQCEDLIDVTYGIKYSGDTVELKTTQRTCTEWQKRNYDVRDVKVNFIYPHQPEQ